MNNLVELSSTLLYTAFLLYLVATLFFSFTIGSKRKSDGKAAKIGITLTIIGFLTQLGYFITRWIGSGHAPVSNLFEYMTFFGMATVLGFIILYFIYKVTVLGLFALPLALIIIAYADTFQDIAVNSIFTKSLVIYPCNDCIRLRSKPSWNRRRRSSRRRRETHVTPRAKPPRSGGAEASESRVTSHRRAGCATNRLSRWANLI